MNLNNKGLFVSTIIVAAGSGNRFGGKKQFYKLRSKPIVLWSIEKFLPVSKEIILLLPEEDVQKFREKWCASYPSLKVFAGGKERFLSVRIGLSHISESSGIICIHDGVRPFVKPGDILRCIEAAKKYGAAICAINASDTVKLSNKNGFISKTIDRNTIYLAQTPQVFRREVIIRAYERGRSLKSTDDSQLVERMGHKVKLVPVEPGNIKITTKSDIVVANQLIKCKK